MSRVPLATAAVVGGGQVALLAAIAIARTAPQTRVTIVATPVGAAALADRAHTTLPALLQLHRRLGITEAAMLTRAGATHRVATRYEGFGPAPFAVAFGAASEAALADPADSAVLALGSALAAEERFATPSDDAAEPLADLDYALRFVPAAYHAHLVALAQHLEIAIVGGVLRHVERDAAGDVAALVLDGGARVAAELFVDAGGPAAALRAGSFVSWGERLLADHLLDAVPLPPALSVRDTATGHGDAYLLRSPGRDATRLTLAWRGARLDHDAAAALLRRGGGEPAETIAFAPGRAADAWSRNVIAIGDAAATLEPLGATNLQLAVRQIELLMELLPATPIAPSERAEYNRRAALLAESTADFVAAHHCSGALRRSDALARTIDLYARRGHLVRWTEDAIAADLWRQLLAGVIGPRADAPALALPPARRAALAAAAGQRIARGVAAAQPYPAWLAGELRRLA